MFKNQSCWSSSYHSHVGGQSKRHDQKRDRNKYEYLQKKKVVWSSRESLLTHPADNDFVTITNASQIVGVLINETNPQMIASARGLLSTRQQNGILKPDCHKSENILPETTPSKPPTPEMIPNVTPALKQQNWNANNKSYTYETFTDGVGGTFPFKTPHAYSHNVGVHQDNAPITKTTHVNPSVRLTYVGIFDNMIISCM